MHKYIPLTKSDKKEMLESLDMSSMSELFNDIPEDLKFKKDLDILGPMSELELGRYIKDIAKENKSTDDLVCFLGAGAYDHVIPSVVGRLAMRSEFYTSYTPYQAEISQGTLRVIFEYQTMVAELTGMEVSNASLYDGQTAAVEAAFMAINKTRKNKIIISETMHPETIKVVDTYLETHDVEVVKIPSKNGVTDMAKLEEAVDKNTAGVITQSPNFFGIIEDVEKMVKITNSNSKKALFIQSVDPISLGVLKTPGEMGVDIAIGDNQALGNALNFGGPYLGFITTTSKLVRKIPGRVVGQTEDHDGNRAFTLTLQTREQHIRREKATSNICSNQGLNALMATIFLSTVGKKGIKEIATQSLIKAHYTFDRITALDGFEPVFDKPFFKEFAVKSSMDSGKINKELLNNNILGGYDLSKDYNELPNSLLYCVTEKRSKDEIDMLVNSLEGIVNE